MTNDETLRELQILLSHHERQIQDLSDIVTEQAKQIEALAKRLEKTNHKLSEMELVSQTGGEGLSVAEQALRDKPPHY